MGLRALVQNIAGAITTDISVSQWKSKAGNVAKSAAIGAATGAAIVATGGAAGVAIGATAAAKAATIGGVAALSAAQSAAKRTAVEVVRHNLEK